MVICYNTTQIGRSRPQGRGHGNALACRPTDASFTCSTCLSRGRFDVLSISARCTAPIRESSTCRESRCLCCELHERVGYIRGARQLLMVKGTKHLASQFTREQAHFRNLVQASSTWCCDRSGLRARRTLLALLFFKKLQDRSQAMHYKQSQQAIAFWRCARNDERLCSYGSGA